MAHQQQQPQPHQPILPRGHHQSQPQSNQPHINPQPHHNQSGYDTPTITTTTTTVTTSVIPWPIDKDQYELGQMIGVGATATVHTAWCIPRRERCAIKRINLEKWSNSMDELLKEIQSMSACSHENVVTYYTSFVVKDELWLVIRLLSGGSLLDIIKYKMRSGACRYGVFDEPSIATVLKEVLRGLDYLHKTGQIHRDIKAGNILLGDDGTVQIADFGVSAWLSTTGDTSRDKMRHTFVGTPCWMAPEVMEQVTGYDFKADIWSLGITVLELITGTAPYHKYPPMKVLMLTLQNEPPTLETCQEEREQYKSYGKTIRKFVAECLQKDPTKRPTAADLLKHPFITRKSRDKGYVQRMIAAHAPPLEERLALCSSRIRPPSAGGQYSTGPSPTPGTGSVTGGGGVPSGRLHRSEGGNWTWSSDDEGDHDQQQQQSQQQNNRLRPDNGPRGPGPGLPAHPPPVPPPPLCNSGVVPPPASFQGGVDRGSRPGSGLGSGRADRKLLNMVLRIRNKRNELNDIRFEFTKEDDSTRGIAEELYGAGLVEEKDLDIITHNMDKLVDNHRTIRTLVFELNLENSTEIPDEKILSGYAQLTVTD